MMELTDRVDMLRYDEIQSKIIQETNLVESLTNQLERINSFQNLSTEESNEDILLVDLEEMIEDLLTGKKDLKDLPVEVKKYDKDIQNLPNKPKRPEDWECCGTGCCPCIWDIYDRDLEVHTRAVDVICEKINLDRVDMR